MKVFRGRLVHSLKPEKIEILEDAVIGYSERDGKIHFVEKYPSNIEELMQMYGFCDSDVQLLTEGQFLMPGFVDAHVHAAQHQISRAMEKGETLIEWLKQCVYPLEEKFSDTAFAHNIYDEIVRRTLHCGSTTVNYFGTIYLESTKELCQVIEKYGQRALVGKVNMDTRSGKYVETTEDSIKDTLEFIDFVTQMKGLLVQPVITPRFLASCTESLLTRLAKIAIDKGLRIQSFFCEEKNEIVFILSECHTDGQSCTEIMDSVGLLNDKAFMIHANILEENELQLFKKRDTGVIHCPTTNLSQGIYTNIRDRLSRGLKVALGSDYCWGASSSSILDIMRDAKNVSMIVKKQVGDHEYEPLTIDELFYMATLGGAKVLSMEDQIGNFEVNKQFDALLVDMNNTNLPLMSENIVEDFLQYGTDKNIVNVFVAGKQVVPYEVEKTLEDNEITRDIYEKYSQEDGVIPFKAVKWIIVGPPQVGKTTTKMRLLNQIHNIRSEGGDVRPDSTGIEKPLEIMSATMIQHKGNQNKSSLYWNALDESKLGRALMCYINSHSSSIDYSSTYISDSGIGLSSCSFEDIQHRKDLGDHQESQSSVISTSTESSLDLSRRNSLMSESTNNEAMVLEYDLEKELPRIEEEDESQINANSVNIETEYKLKRGPFTLREKIDMPKQVTLVFNYIKRQCSDVEFLQLLEEIKGSIADSVSIYITDTGGQPEFLCLLPVILSRPAMYFVFFSLAQPLDQEYTVRYTKDRETCDLYMSNHTVKDILSQLLSSLHIHTEDDKFSKVKSTALLFGTNADHPYKDVDKINDELKETLPLDSNYVTSVESKFTTAFIPVNNMSGTENEIIKIRQYLEKLVNDIEPVSIPVRWLIFHLLLRKRFKEAKVCSLKDCEQLAKECSIAKDDIKPVLTYIHQNLGTILYYEKVDENVIVCVPEVLLKIISQVVASTMLNNDKHAGPSCHGEIGINVVTTLMSDAKEIYGYLDSQYVIKVMKHFQLITTLTVKDAISIDDNSVPLFLPCLLRPDGNNNPVPTDQVTLVILFGKDEMPPHLFQNLIVALRAQSISGEIGEKESQLMWTLSHDHPRYSDHIYFKVFKCYDEWFVELQLRKFETSTCIEVRCEPTTINVSSQSIHHKVYQNIKTILYLVCDMFPHTRDLKPMYGAYCCDGSSFSEYNEKISGLVYNNCDCDKSEAMFWFKPTEIKDSTVEIKTETKDVESQIGSKIIDAAEQQVVEKSTSIVQTKSMEQSLAKVDKSVQFNYLIPSNGTNSHHKSIVFDRLSDTLHGVCIGGEKLFLIQGDSPQFLEWEEYGLKITVYRDTLSPTETSEVALSALVGGQFQFPESSVPISAIYAISVSKPLLQPVKLEIQHCADLVTKDHTKYLSFATAFYKQDLPPYKFQLTEGGHFYPGNQYGSIFLSKFSFLVILEICPCFDTPEEANSESEEGTNQNGSSVVEPSLEEVLDKTISLPHSLTTDDMEPCQQLSSLINSTDQSLREVNRSPHPNRKYVAQVVYETKHHNREWLMRIMVAKCLNCLLKYIETSLPPNIEKDVDMLFTFQENDGSNELILGEIEKHPLNGWSINPHRYPTLIDQSDVDMYGSQDPPYFPSILITVSVENGPNTATRLNYCLSVKGIKPDNTKIVIVRSCNNAGGGVSRINPTIETVHVARNPAPDPSEIFRTHIADICDAFATNLDRVTNSLFAKKLIVHEVYQSTLMTEGVSNYRKAGRLVNQLYSHVKAHNEPKQYLTAICDVMLKQDDQKLKDIANQIQINL